MGERKRDSNERDCRERYSNGRAGEWQGEESGGVDGEGREDGGVACTNSFYTIVADDSKKSIV